MFCVIDREVQAGIVALGAGDDDFAPGTVVRSRRHERPQATMLGSAMEDVAFAMRRRIEGGAAPGASLSRNEQRW